ncbi:unnamed protein product [Pedinophyceae sp. YPF-701]|nr:unnamed protein product [Pedinophyceae sp. YPF-701]
MDDIHPEKQIMFENTYILEPEGYGEGQKFLRHEVLAILQDVIDSNVKGQVYDARKAPNFSKMLADTVLARVKDLGYTRYKTVCQVTVGERIGQAMRVVSRCLWDTKTDNSASLSYESQNLYVVLQVFGVYLE